MRPILAAATTATLAAALAGCGDSEAAFRDAYRARSVEGCTNGVRTGAAGAGVLSGVDFNRLCECAVDRYMAETPIEQLRAEEKQTNAPPAVQRALTQCLTEQMSSGKG